LTHDPVHDPARVGKPFGSIYRLLRRLIVEAIGRVRLVCCRRDRDRNLKRRRDRVRDVGAEAGVLFRRLGIDLRPVTVARNPAAITTFDAPRGPPCVVKSGIRG